jgi:hypothetical protein
MQNSTQNKETPVNQTICEKTNGTNVQRTYKSRLFEMIFSEKTELLELYNAMNETNYVNPELLEINTLENAIFMSMHNDILTLEAAVELAIGECIKDDILAEFL